MPMDQRLFVAAQKGDMEVVEEYKDQFATQLTPYNNTLLHVAALYAPLSWKINPMVFLAMVGPDLFFRLNSNGDTFIHLAAKRGQCHLIQAFINYMKSCGGLGIIDIEAGITKARELLRITNNDGNTTLHLAAMHYHCRDTVEVLVKEDADFSYPPNNAGKTPLYLAAEMGYKYSVGFMMNNCSSPSYAGPYGTTALHAAIMYGATDCTEIILRETPSLIKKVDDFGWNPLHYAAYLGYKGLVRTLLMADKQMAYDTTNEENKTPLHLEAQNNKLEVIEEILEQCPDTLEVLTSQGQNALHVAYANGHQALMHLIRQCGLISGIIDMKDADGNTPEDAKGKSMLCHPIFEELIDRKSTACRRSKVFIRKQ